MKSLILLAVICFVYYQVYKKYQLEIPQKYNIYFGVFVGGYLLWYYLMEFQKPFIYKIFSSVHNVDRPMYEIQTQSYSNNQNVLKNNLALRQGFRCIGCQNPILQQDVDKHQLQYFKSLDYGGQPTPDNLCLKCPSCSAFGN